MSYDNGKKTKTYGVFTCKALTTETARRMAAANLANIMREVDWC